MMRLVAAAFEAGIATLLAAGAWRASLAGALDSLVTAAWVFSERGDNVLHRNASAGLLTMEDPQSAHIEAAISALARGLSRSVEHTKSAGGNPSTVRANTTVRTETATYSLCGSYVGAARLAPTRTILVVARRTTPRPLDRAVLRHRYALSPRELQTAELVFEGFAAGEIAQHLGISVHTARRHMEQLYRKLGVHSRGEAQRILRR
jgi:DNA-binding CsgD family transcriptional regulator